MAREIRHPAPAADWETRAYWEGAARGELVLQRCRGCGVQGAVLVLGQQVPGLRAIQRVHFLRHRRQQPTHRHPRAVQPRLHGSHRHIREDGDFRVREPLHIREEHHPSGARIEP